MPKRKCVVRGCPNPTIEGTANCQVHAWRWRGAPLLSRFDRGYGNDWTLLRKAHLKDHPYCVACGSTTHLEVDHIIPFQGREDPRRTDPANLQTLCHACHEKKTVKQGRPGGLSRTPRAS